MADQLLFTTPDDALAHPMLAELTAEYDRRYGDYFGPAGASAEMNRYPASAFQPPEGNFLLLLRDGVAIAGGAFKRLDAHTAEFKRIWSHHAHRRQGLAASMVAALEAQAAQQGYRRVYLTTGFRQPEAVALYLSQGYQPLFDLQADPARYGTLPFEKNLHPAGTARDAAAQPIPFVA
ncbi:GNAT family N-acetyltransferase [Vogesella sp. LIG4]|uniref:GNAT family N-acetyltransferase n=1 Tax=Vogesella sp. LIG4 TaxID=1192162 RepID=UPI00081FBAC0|nr:GNAT family N-acetyltransferase [Vogesella sp. LIG4]SCK26694.1 N-acetylglutamate synthase and related acetyltransferases [Vogesella sp. LIG4]